MILRPWVLPLASIPLLAAACNSVLGNDQGELFEAPDASSPEVLVASVEAGVDTSTPPLALEAGDTSPPPPEDAGSDQCPQGKKRCDGLCVAVDDPAYGCTTTSCRPCSLARATASCAGLQCSIAACNPGFADCDQNAADGCETDLSQPSHCGTCNAVCAATSPLCSPQGTQFGCTTGCGAQAPTLCGSQCVDLQTSVTHCGGCNTICPDIANATESCSGGQCRFACSAGYHACGGACLSNESPQSCGSACTPCSAPANATATCSGTACGFTCVAGFHRCGGACDSNGDVASCGSSCTPCQSAPNATPTCAAGQCGIACVAGFANCNGASADGCEVNLATDTANCGACGRACPAGSACVATACTPVDAGPPDTGPPPDGSAG